VVGEGTIKSIYEFWKDVPDSVIEVLPQFSGPQWIILARIKTQGRFDGCEIGRDDLLQGFPAHKKNEFETGLDGLSLLLNKKPHTGCGFVYSADSHNPIFRDNSPYSAIFSQIRTNGEFKNALINGIGEIFTVDEGLKNAITATLNKLKGKSIDNYIIRPVINGRNLEPGALNTLLTITYLCPKASRKQDAVTQECIFKINQVGEFYNQEATIDVCRVCKNRHKVKSNGRIW
jgi:hypothetical protein